VPISISRQKLVDALVDGITTIRNAVNRISVPRYIKSMGTATPSSGATYIDISDTDVDDNYTILVEANWNTTVYITNKSSGGFRINFGTSAPSGAQVRWVKVRSA
jgi:hypothetical protein